ncbi:MULTISPECIES: hypothetical protein [unclassified Bradyrhizobium]|uniref:hypothetical protein n=1 Tax=unclassified Bradyrhizobium TaxID=2631580 RepID=UPI00209EAB75|nr:MULTISPECIES: hypothetical protein [unclassified Bradyrhizobium]MCP1838937.1 hypothetical protein [Bradyrhizobium sp. USDA 4538]MCP1899504.1 hypothetical protein [Bradyrhizobium sp. USDA 4537]MCP1909789.1 hypothetical protein [Bradyrhizobium elkanii]MCP1986387.1 hypothetical protein [Bradyrhizobium sp. USDA 4539]
MNEHTPIPSASRQYDAGQLDQDGSAECVCLAMRVERLMRERPYSEQYFYFATGIIALARRYERNRLEAAYESALNAIQLRLRERRRQGRARPREPATRPSKPCLCRASIRGGLMSMKEVMTVMLSHPPLDQMRLGPGRNGGGLLTFRIDQGLAAPVIGVCLQDGVIEPDVPEDIQPSARGNIDAAGPVRHQTTDRPDMDPAPARIEIGRAALKEQRKAPAPSGGRGSRDAGAIVASSKSSMDRQPHCASPIRFVKPAQDTCLPGGESCKSALKSRRSLPTSSQGYDRSLPPFVITFERIAVGTGHICPSN